MEFKVISCCLIEFFFRRIIIDMMLRRWDFFRVSSSFSEYYGFFRECFVSTIKDFWYRLIVLVILVKIVLFFRKFFLSIRILRFWCLSNGFSFNSVNILFFFGLLVCIRNILWVMLILVFLSFVITYFGVIRRL